MKVAIVVGHSVPNPTAGGATLTNWTVLHHLVEHGHDVTVLPLLGPEYVDPTGATLEERVAPLESLGVTVLPVPSHVGSAEATDELIFPTLADRGAMREALESVRPDVVFAYHWEALAALDGVHVAPKLGVAVDPTHLSYLYRWRSDLRQRPAHSLRILPLLLTRLRRHPQLMVRVLSDCDASGNFAAHHAAWFRKHGVPGCEYLRTPVPDPLGDDWSDARKAAAVERPRLLLMGHLRGISTLEGLHLALEGVLPELERSFGADGFEVRLVGGYDPPPELAALVDRPSVTLCGHTDDPSPEFLSAHAILVPTPIRLGTRVRIISAFAHGTPVVAHAANAAGIPELVHGDNALLGKNASELAAGVTAIFRDAALRERLSTRGRETFEESFAPPVAAGRIEQVLARIAGETLG
jgi:glycosyltransferase involved in cell wall biosynthesis